MTSVPPPQAWREQREWPSWLGKTGVVAGVTVVSVASPELQVFTPYSYVLVKFADGQHEFMGAVGETFTVGDEVECVLRRLEQPDERGVIHYGIKVRKV